MIQNNINDLYSNFIAYRTYSRWLDDLKRRETWEDAVQRYADYLSPRVPADLKESFNSSIAKIKNKEVMPSMRLLWSAGPACEENNFAAFNCAYVALDSSDKFGEMLYVLMHGTGVGYSVERQYVGELPEVPQQLTKHNDQFIIADSKLGWKLAYDYCINMLYDGYIPSFNYSLIRPKGARLKTFGGRASGPQPLKQLLEFTIKIFTNAAGRKLNSLEVHDLCCMIANCVVVGGVRRSACISFSNLSDQRMKHAKDGQFWLENPQRSMANNSIAYTEKPDCGMFMEEWLNLMRSGSGERGIINTQALAKKGQFFNRKDVGKLRTNPCQPAFAKVITPDGLREFGDIKVGSYVWSGSQFTKVVDKWFTGVKPVYKYSTTCGSFIGTDNHRIVQQSEKVEVRDATAIDICVGPQQDNIVHNYTDIMDGLLIGDGSVHKASNNLVYLNIGSKDQDYFDFFKQAPEKYIIVDRRVAFKNGWEVLSTVTAEELPKTYDREIPDRFHKGSPNTVCGFLKGLFSANGSIAGKRVTLKQTSYKLITQVQDMLSSVGIPSYITVNKSRLNTFSNGDYVIKESYDLNITTGREAFRNQIGFIQQYKIDALDDIIDTVSSSRSKQTYEIISKEYLGDFEVFDMTVAADEHTYWTGGLLVSNCGEALLPDRGLCNLTEVLVRPKDTTETLKDKIASAVLLGCLQSTLTHFPNVSQEWKENAEAERLLGVSLSGTCDSQLFKKVDDKTKQLVAELRKYAHECANTYAKMLLINNPLQITLTKPSGTVSQLCNTASGLHPRYADYYIRRVRVNAKDPIAKLLVDKNIPWNYEVGQTEAEHTTLVFDFPMKSPRGSINRHDWTAIEQLEYWSMFNQYWADGNPSVTIYVNDDEWVEVGAWVYRNWDQVCGLSFLPKDGGVYQLAPYEEIDAETYHNTIKNWKNISIDFGTELSRYEMEDNTEGAKTYACVGGSCELN